MITDKLIERAVKFIRVYKDWTAEQEKGALNKIMLTRCCIEYASHEISSNILALLSEFQDAQGLPENWWSEQGTLDDWFMMI